MVFNENNTNTSQFVKLSKVAKVLTTQAYKKQKVNTPNKGNDLIFSIKKEISLNENVGHIDLEPDLDYVVYISSVPLMYISFLLNSKYGYNSLGRVNQRKDPTKVSLSRLKDTIIPFNDHMDDCCYLEKVLSYTKESYLTLDEKDVTREVFPFLFFLSYLYRVKSYMILEMFRPEVFRQNNFSMLNSWRIEREKMGNEIPDFFLLNNLLKSLITDGNQLTSDMDKIRTLANNRDFSPIL